MADPAGAQPVRSLRLRDGRCLAYNVFGAALCSHTEMAVLYFHGVPSCHLEAMVLDEPGRELGLPVVSMDRVGIGMSDNKVLGVSPALVAEDACELARHLQLKRCICVGNSGGGPYAAAFAALFPDITHSLVLIAAVAPTNLTNLPLLGAMKGADFLQFALVRLPPMGGLWSLHATMAYMAKNHIDTLLEQAPKGMAAADGEALRRDERVREAFGRCLRHAYCRGSRGMARDVRVLGGRWGIDFSAIKCKVMIWQGEADQSVPVRHACWWASTLPGSKLTLMPGEGHVTVLLRHAKDILSTALQWNPQAEANKVQVQQVLQLERQQESSTIDFSVHSTTSAS